MIRIPNQKHNVLWFHITDQTAGLLNQLDVKLRLKADISWQQIVHFVDEDDGRVVLFGAGEQNGELLNRSPSVPAENIGPQRSLQIRPMMVT